MQRIAPGLCFIVLFSLIACSGEAPSPEPVAEAQPSADAPPADAQAAETPAEVWFRQLGELCGNAYAGRLVSTDAVDAEFAEQAMVMHVRRCADDRIEVPFHVGENRSRTWVLSRTDDGGIQLQHDHRHEDGSEDAVTLYGGRTAEAGSATAQDFPADDYSKQLFETHDLAASVANTWTMEIVPGERFSYILRRPERHFQVDFDLTVTVDAPPTPWGHEETAPTEASAG
ncbi:MAG: hypothetical protein AAGE94_19805 [Acidobacteriota bacterium]